MIFNRNQNGQAAKEPNKATSVDEDVATVDWMIMTDIGTRINKIPNSKPEAKPEAKSEFKQTTKQEPNKLAAIATSSQVSSNQSADDDREDIEWLQSLDLDKPIERSVPTKKNTANNQQNAANSATNNGNSDVEKIDWLIVSDLKTKKVDSGFNNTNSSINQPINSQNSIPDHAIPQASPPSEEIGAFGDSNLENDFGDLGLDDLELIADDDLGDLQFDDLDEMRLNELISGIGVTDSKLQELSELMDDEFFLDDYADSTSEHELDTILGISKVRYPNDKLGIVNDSFEISTQHPEFIVAKEELDKEIDDIDIISEQQYSQFEQDYAQEYFEVDKFDSLEEGLNLEENLSDDINNSEESFAGLEGNLVDQFDDLAEYPATEYPSDDLLEYAVDDLGNNDLTDDDLSDYPVVGYASDDLAEYAIDDYSSSDLAEYPIDDLAGYPYDNLAEYPANAVNDLQENLPENLDLSHKSQDEYLTENFAITEGFQVSQDVFASDNFDRLNHSQEFGSQEFGSQEIRASDLVNPLDDDFGEMRSPIVLEASLLGDEIWTNSAIASPEDMNGAKFESNFDPNFEDAFASDWNEVPQDVSNDSVWDSSANISPEILSSAAIDNAFGSADDWEIAPQADSSYADPLQADSIQSEPFDLPINVGFELPPDLSIDLHIDLPSEEQFLQGLDEDIEVPLKSTVKSPFTEQEYLELQEYDRIFAAEEATPEYTSEKFAELAIASNPPVGIAVDVSQENTHLQSEIDDLGWNPESENQLLAELDTDDYAEWNNEPQFEISSDISNDPDLDWNEQSRIGLVVESELTDYDDYAEWQSELQPEVDNDTSWQDDLDSLIDSPQYLDDFDVSPDEIPQVVISAGTVHGHSNDGNDLENYLDSASDLSSDWDDFEEPLADQITDSDFADDFSDFEAASLLDSPLNSPDSNDWKPDENQATVVDDFDDMESIIDENFDLASFDEDKFPEIPLINSDNVNIATTLTPNRVSPIPTVGISKPEFTPEFADLSAPAIAAKEDFDHFSEDILLEEAFANDLLNQNYDLDVDPFEEALASDLLNGYTSNPSGFNQFDDFVPASETLPPPNRISPSTFVMAPSNKDFLDNFDFDSIEIEDFSGKNNSGFPAITTGLTPSAPSIKTIAQSEPTSPPVNNSFLPLPPLPPKRNPTQGRPTTAIAQNPPIQSQNIQPRRSYADSMEEDSDFDGFHTEDHQNQSQNERLNQVQNLARTPINSIDESWSDLLNAETVISGVLHSPSANMNANVAMPQGMPLGKGTTAGRNSQGRDSRDQPSARNNFQRQPNNLPDFTDLGLEIHDDNTDWSGLLDSDEANDSITSISTQMPPLPRAQADISAFNTSITGSSATREIPRDRRQPAAYVDANQVRMGSTPDQMNFNRFTEDNYVSYGSSQGIAAQNRNKPQPKTSTLSLEAIWQNYLKIPVIGLGAIGAAFLLYTLANKPIFDLGLRWGIFKDAS
ncbi:MAG: hypothetical protein ACOYN8_09995, partial [Pseudanabaena sp.]